MKTTLILVAAGGLCAFLAWYGAEPAWRWWQR
jgi:hypothetical protein